MPNGGQLLPCRMRMERFTMSHPTLGQTSHRGRIACKSVSISCLSLFQACVMILLSTDLCGSHRFYGVDDSHGVDDSVLKSLLVAVPTDGQQALSSTPGAMVHSCSTIQWIALSRQCEVMSIGKSLAGGMQARNLHTNRTTVRRSS